MDVFANSLDDVSAGSSTEFPDRLSLMEARLQTQEDEMTLLKSALSDALRRLRVYDEQIPLLRQHILAGNPAAGRGCSCVSDGASSHCKLSTSSNPDWPKRSSSQRYSRETRTGVDRGVSIASGQCILEYLFHIHDLLLLNRITFSVAAVILGWIVTLFVCVQQAGPAFNPQTPADLQQLLNFTSGEYFLPQKVFEY